MESGSLKLLKK